MLPPMARPYSLRINLTLRTVATLILASLAPGAFDASGANVTWINAGTGNWVDGLNWDTGNPPNSFGVTNDVALINNGGTAMITASDTVSTGAITLWRS